jgi:hypothetical protein
MDKENMVYIHMDYYLAIKKNEIISCARKWMEPEVMMLRLMNQMQKDKYHVFLCYVEAKIKF